MSVVPNEFKKIILDLTKDILITFPEFKTTLEYDLTVVTNEEIDDTEKEESFNKIYEHCKLVFPERFFDILYKKDEIFKDSSTRTDFLPGLEFKLLWNDDNITDSTHESLWKYLQLIMFTVLETIKTQDSFGDTAKLFEAIDEDELKAKIQDTVETIQESLTSNDKTFDAEINLEDLPNVENLHNHISGLLDGKLGKLATEIAAETAKDLKLDIDEEITDVNDVFNRLFQNPGKLFGLVNNISKKLDNKLKSGELNEKELMQEAGDLISKMNNMPGMPDIQELLKKMNVPSMNKNLAKNKLQQQTSIDDYKARLRRKLECRRALKHKEH